VLAILAMFREGGEASETLPRPAHEEGGMNPEI